MIKLQNKNDEVNLSPKRWKGDPGGYYEPAVDTDGNLTWTASEEDMPAVEGVNIKGPKGDPGGVSPDQLKEIEDTVINKISTDGFATKTELEADYAKKSELFSKDYNDLTNEPTIPTKVSELENDKFYTTYNEMTSTVIDLTSDKLDENAVNAIAITKDNEVKSWVEAKNYATKSEVPDPYTLPVASATALGGVKVGAGLSINDGVLSATGGGGTAGSVDWNNVNNKPNFATVATSGSYNDLSDTPTIPSTSGLASETYVNEKIAEIVIPTVPTKVSAFENDKGYLTEHQSLANYALKSEIPDTTNFTTMSAVEAKGYQTASEVETAITGKGYTTMTAVEGKGYQTEAQVNALINSAIGSITNGNEVSY